MSARGAIAALLILGAVVAYPRAGTHAEVTLGTGTHEGADFIIGMPARARWNGDLVMFAHGYEGEGPGRGTVRPPPLSAQLTKRGYAWAASGYRSKGYHPDWLMADALALRERFIKELGRPKRTIIHGQSNARQILDYRLTLDNVRRVDAVMHEMDRVPDRGPEAPRADVAMIGALAMAWAYCTTTRGAT